MTKKEMANLGRRHALKLVGAATLAPLFKNPVSHLIDSMVKGIIHTAKADATGEKKPRNLMVFYMTSGAPRWTLDGVLDPYKPAVSGRGNKQTLTGRNTNGSADWVKIPFQFSGGRTLYLPPMWNSSLPKVGGGSVPMSEVLRNAMVMQGINMLSDGHPSNAVALVMPNSSSPTYGGLISDASSTSIPAVGLPNGIWDHRSPSGGGISLVGDYSDPLGQLLSPFRQQTTDSNFLSRRAAMDLAMKTALQKLGQFAGSSDPAAMSLYSAQSKAEKLLKSSLGDLAGAYSTLETKYRNLMRAAIDQGKTGVMGITDQAILASNFDSAQLQYNLPGTFSTQTDLRNLVTDSSYVNNLVENFAIAEYMVTNGYSQYVSGGFGPLVNVAPLMGGPLGTAEPDEHSTGGILSLVIQNARFRSFYACLYELISVLKSKNMWDESVILYGSEFNREPRPDGSGADHGWWANVYTLLSGAIDGPYFVGNTRDVGGSAGPTLVGSTKVELTRGYVASTVAAAVRIASPNENNSSFLVEGSNGSLELGGVELSKEVA